MNPLLRAALLHAVSFRRSNEATRKNASSPPRFKQGRG